MLIYTIFIQTIKFNLILQDSKSQLSNDSQNLLIKSFSFYERYLSNYSQTSLPN